MGMTRSLGSRCGSSRSPGGGEVASTYGRTNPITAGYCHPESTTSVTKVVQDIVRNEGRTGANARQSVLPMISAVILRRERYTRQQGSSEGESFITDLQDKPPPEFVLIVLE